MSRLRQFLIMQALFTVEGTTTVCTKSDSELAERKRRRRNKRRKRGH